MLASGCATVRPDRYRTLQVDVSSAGSLWRGIPVATGQIIVSEHPGATALFLSLTAERFEPYVHVGLLLIEDGEPWVYDAMGVTLPLPWSQPNAHVGGGVRRVKLARFLRRGGIVGLYAPPAGTDAAAVAAFARESRQRKVPFDNRYDASDAERYYCAEFVARALAAGGAGPFERIPVTRNASVRVALDWLGIDTPDLLLAGSVLRGARRVAVLSDELDASGIERYFALKRELHRRFTGDQRVGNLLFWSGQSLRLRPQVDAFYERGVASGIEPARLADELFGPLQPET